MKHEFISIARAAVDCNACFADGAVTRDNTIGLPQPFYKGPGYDAAARRVLIVGINPGSGSGAPYKQARKTALEAFRAGDDEALPNFWLATLTDVQRYWNPKYLARIEELRLELPEIALGNIALCATSKNGDYKSERGRAMLARCFSEHSFYQIKALAPHVVVMMGAEVKGFAEQIKRASPGCVVVAMTHYAALGSHLREDVRARMCATVRAAIEGAVRVLP